VRVPASASASVSGAVRQFQSPLYHQIFLILKQRILEGDLAPGDGVPGEQELAQIHGVSRITAKRALDELADAGLVVRERGRGTSVAPRLVGEPVRADASGAMDPLIIMGGATDVSVLSCEELPADRAVAEALEIEAGATVQRAVRVRRIAEGPFSYLTTHVPAWAAVFDAADLAGAPMLALLERAGLRPSSAKQEMSVTLADAVVAEHLAVDVGAPLMRVRRVVRDQTGRAIELIEALYRCDRYRMTMSLTRSVAGETGSDGNTWDAVWRSVDGQE
jgi:GntR family transcriptional regulator